MPLAILSPRTLDLIGGFDLHAPDGFFSVPLTWPRGAGR